MGREAHLKSVSTLKMLYQGLLALPLVLFSYGSCYVFSDFTFNAEPKDIIVAVGHAAMLDCSAQQANTAPDIRWQKGGAFITEDNRRYKFTNGSLYFEQIEHTRTHKPDEGIYQCVATVADMGSIVSSKGRLTVAYLDRLFEQEPQDLTVHLGDTAMFPCKMGGAPKPTVRWFQDELQIDPYDVDYHIHMDGVLEIQSVQFNHLGRYKCKVENTDRSRTSEVIQLQQDSDLSTYKGVPPRFVMMPSDTVAIEGTTVMLYCGANGRDRTEDTPQINWLKDGSTIDMSDLDTRFTIVGQGSLRIDALNTEDSGMYTCRARNDEDSIDAIAILSVHVAPRFLRRPKNIATAINADVELECEVDGIPKPRITWLHNGDEITPTNYFQISDGHNLKILGVVETDAGMYQCFAESEVGNIESSAQLVIVEPDSPSPTFHSVLPTNVHNLHSGNHSASTFELPSTPNHLEAAFVASRFITLSWRPPSQTGTSEITNYVVYFKEQGSNRERTQNTTQLDANIQHLKPGARYTFRVVAYNNAGPSPVAAEITVKTDEELSVPGPPGDLVASPLTPHSIRVDWSAPLDGAADITTYKLFYYEVGGTEQEQDLNTEQQTTYTLSDLKGYREYAFRVLAYNTNGAGVSTTEVIARTYSGKPSEPPQNVTAEATSSKSIEIHWEPPPTDTCNGIITGYKVRYRLRDQDRNDKAQTITTDGNRRDYELTGLNPKTAYQVRVLAMTVNGTGPPSEWITVDTLETDLDETMVPGGPQAIHVRPMTDSILISWTPPAEQDIMIRGYVLGYGINVPDVFKQVLKAKQRYYTIKNLQSDSTYVISLRAFNNIGEGVPIYETATTRRATTPEPMTPMDPPLGLKDVVTTPTTVLLTWTDIGLGDNQHVNDNRYYTVAYNPKTSHKKKYVNSTDLNVHVDDLKPDTEYEFSVKVIKGRRSSPPSMSIFVRTHEAVPATTPRDVTPVGYPDEPRWVTLSWQPPRTPNGQLTGYMVYYTTDATKPDDHWAQDRLPGDQLTTIIQGLSLQTTYYFKVEARNSKGYGPPSPTVVYRTPRADGHGGGMLELPDDYGHPANDQGRPGYRPGDSYDFGHGQSTYDDPYKLLPGDRRSQDKDDDKGGLSPMVMWIIIGSISGVTVIVVIIVTVILCRRKMTDADRKAKRGPGYKPANKAMGMKDHIKPPDLWIDQMELKNLDKGSRDTTASVSPLPRGDNDYNDEAIAMAVPNGHLSDRDMGGNPIRPIYPRTQYTSQYTSTPRVNAGDVTAPPSVRPQPQQQSNQPTPTSPYKKGAPAPNIAAQAALARSPLPVVTPRAPDVTRCGGHDDSSDYGGPNKSVSTEDLTAQMANLEGLMKDLNAITQQEFEC